MAQMNELLPIGSIIILKEAKKRLMIFGIKQTDGEDSEKTYDYVGVIYPEGNMGLKSQFLFNHEDIQNIYFRGYDDIERQDFIAKLSELYEKPEVLEK